MIGLINSIYNAAATPQCTCIFRGKNTCILTGRQAVHYTAVGMIQTGPTSGSTDKHFLLAFWYQVLYGIFTFPSQSVTYMLHLKISNKSQY